MRIALFQIVRLFKKHRRRIKELVGDENAEVLFYAIKKDIPIIVIERNTSDMIDGELYRSLKALGARCVYNHDILLEKKKEIKGVYCAYINERYL